MRMMMMMTIGFIFFLSAISQANGSPIKTGSQLFGSGLKPVQINWQKGEAAFVSPRNTLVSMYFSAESAKKTGLGQTAGWYPFIMEAGEVFVGRVERSDKEFHYVRVLKLMRPDCENPCRGEIKIIVKKAALIEQRVIYRDKAVPITLVLVVEIGGPVFRTVTVTRMVEKKVEVPVEKVVKEYVEVAPVERPFIKPATRFSPPRLAGGRDEIRLAGGSAGFQASSESYAIEIAFRAKLVSRSNAAASGGNANANADADANAGATATAGTVTNPPAG